MDTMNTPTKEEVCQSRRLFLSKVAKTTGYIAPVVITMSATNLAAQVSLTAPEPTFSSNAKIKNVPKKPRKFKNDLRKPRKSKIDRRKRRK